MTSSYTYRNLEVIVRDRKSSPNLHLVCILLGSNILPEMNIPQAIRHLSRHIIVARISSVWESEAVGSPGPNFLNAALLGYSPLHPARLKTRLLRPLEAKMGRVRTSDKNAARTIDLDVVVFDWHPIDHHLWEYAHAAVPVAEVMPEITNPVTGDRLQQVAKRLARQTCLTRRSDLSLPVITSSPTINQIPLILPNSRLFMR